MINVVAELRRPEGPPSRAPYPYRKEKEILMVIRASGIACGRVRTTTTAELIEVTCFLKLIAVQVLVFDWIKGSCHVNLL